MISSIKKFTKQLWWAVVSVGFVSIIFGLVAMIWPDATLSIFIYLFSLFVMIISAVVLGQSLTRIKTDRLWWLTMLFAVCGISIGLYIMINPQAAQAFIAVLLAIYIFSQSLLDLVVASYSDDDKAKTPVIIVGIIGVIFGFIVLFQPILATNALVWVIGLYILAHGIAAEYYAFKVRNKANKVVKAVKEAMFDNEPQVIEAEIVKKPTKKSKNKTKSGKSV